ncbi:uncharacterized protein BJX67DRAFT_377907 [Aspergillus lucknowensis]|uniref:DUF7702 domain-containing protein n=1 Tax=Aspergillus lucknowensis TaxID=176173 RepID=A0ABR4M1F3_9EURO
MAAGLPIAQLVLYSPLTLAVLYVLCTHDRHGVLAWAYLLAFCILRLSGNALAINDPHNAGAQIISSIGLSPLLLCIDGVLHEARVLCIPSLNRKLEYTFIAFFHVLVATGVAMVGVGAGGLVSDTPTDSDLSDVKVGMALLEAAWAILVLWALWTLWTGWGGMTNDAAKDRGSQGGILLNAVLIALPLIEISVVYTLVAEYTQRADLSPTTGTLAVRVVLGFLPELIAALILVVAGIRTGDLHRETKKQTMHGRKSRARSRSVRRDAWV